MGLHGIGPWVAARLLADVGDIRRFADRDRFASWNSRRAPGRLLRRPAPPPPVPRRQPTHQPDPAHHGRGPAAQPHRRPHLLRREEGRQEDLDGSHPRPQTAAVQRRLRPHGSGSDLDEVELAAKRAVPQVRLVGCIGSVDRLVRSGRVPGLAGYAGQLFGAKPVFVLERGRVRPLRPAFSQAAALDRMLDRWRSSKIPRVSGGHPPARG